MALAKYLRDSWKNVSPEVYRTRMIDWRRSETIVRVDQPLRLDRARALGYKAKEGVFVVRIRLVRGGHKRMRPRKGRRSVRMTPRKVVSMNYREIAEQRVARKYTNCEVINSYLIGKDGLHAFYEVILVDRSAPTIKNDKQLSYVTNPANKARALRGLTSAGHKARGLRNSTVKAPKVRPSLRANRRRGN